MRWDYEKGNLNDETKRYTVEACRRVKSHGGVLHCFSPSAACCEQENVDWLKEIVPAGHPVGNHTYDHVNVTATRPEDIQFRFQRSPWLIEGTHAGRSDSREHPPDQRGLEDADRHRPGRLPHAGRLRHRADRSARHSADAAGPGLHLGQQPVSAAPGRRARARADGRSVRRHRRRPGQGPAVRLSERPGRSADEPDQRHRRVSQRPLEARVVQGSDPPRRPVGHRQRRGVTTSSRHPSCLYVTDPKFRNDRHDLRDGRQSRRSGRAGRI